MSNKSTGALLLACALAATSLAFARKAKSPAKLKYPIGVTVTSPHHEYQQVAPSIREVDFRNLDYRLFGERIRLRDGKMQRTDYNGKVYPPHLEVTLRGVHYFDFLGNKPSHALVLLDYFAVSASSSDWGFVLVFGVENDLPVVQQQFSYDRQAPGTGDTFSKKAGILTIKARADDGSSHCCPENLETDAFKWAGERFKLVLRRIDPLPSGSLGG